MIDPGMLFACGAALLLLLSYSDGSAVPLRSECVLKENKFENPVKGKALAGHVMSSMLVDSYGDCAIECVGNDSCQSFNYQSESSGLHQCELNNQSANSSESLEERAQFYYYGPTETSPDECSSSPCFNGGTCVRSCDDHQKYECICRGDYVGHRCEIYKGNFDLVFTKQSTSDYAVLDVSSGFTSFTACVWLNTAFYTAEPVILFSYAELTLPHQIRVGCDTNMTRCHMMVDAIARFVEIDSLADGQWHQVCVKWNSTDGNWAFYVDGAKRGHGSKLKAGHVFHGQGKLVLGQRQDAYGGSFAEGKSYVGAMSHFNMWNESTSDHLIKERSRACAVEMADLVHWRKFYDSSHGDVRMQLPSNCQSRVNQSDYLIGYKTRTTADYIHPPTLPTLVKITACFWGQLISGGITVFSYRISSFHRALEMFLGDSAAVHLYIMNNYRRYSSPWMVDNVWHHFCLTWDSDGGLHCHYYDGVQKATFTSFQSGVSVEGGGTLIIGQGQQIDGTHNLEQSFVGNITQFNLWSRVLPGKVIDGMSLGVGAEAGDLVAWPDVRNNVNGNVQVKERPEIMLTARDNNYQMVFGTRSTGNYVKYDGVIPDLFAVTACIWFKTDVSNTYDIPLISYANIHHNNALFFFIKSDTLTLLRSDATRYHAAENLRDGNWNSGCFLWNSVNGVYKSFVNGILKLSATGMKSGVKIGGGGSLVLGQDQDSVGGGFDVTQVFIGTLSNFDMWDVALPDDIIQSMGYGCGTWSGNTISWRNLRSSSYGNVGIQEYSECYIPGVVTRTKRDKLCQDLYASSPATGCSPPLYALFGRSHLTESLLWGCYYSNALTTSIENNAVVYDSSVLSTCTSKRNTALTSIKD
ncbi:uncharacterized protein LOC5510676 [Nematostella vectensis]|uniref:uncharacterized protein LOC5510676 n=1 Tax=Nematostella vectensis TaxID=45351 RepID=UPI002076E3F4|nr:uncharacterized protein LOC5510676 [Nematostella vectensis]